MCCISLACQLHRDTSRILDQCLDKLHRGACSKNTVRFVKNDPDLTCAQCSTRVLEQRASAQAEHISCDGEGCLMTTGRDKNDFDISWTEKNLIEKFSATHLQPTLSILPISRPVSNHFDSYSPGYHQPDDLESIELSHEEGLRLIDDMYGVQNQNSVTSRYMDTNDDGMYFTWAGSHYELEQAQEMAVEITDFVHNDEDGNRCVATISDGSPNQSVDYSFNSNGSDAWDETDVEGHIIDVSDVLQQTRWKLEKFQQFQEQAEQQFLWCLDELKAPVQISIESGY